MFRLEIVVCHLVAGCLFNWRPFNVHLVWLNLFGNDPNVTIENDNVINI